MKALVLLMMGVYGAIASGLLLAGLLGLLPGLRAGFTGTQGWALLSITLAVTTCFFTLSYGEYRLKKQTSA